jgi:hypothetical protein
LSPAERLNHEAPREETPGALSLRLPVSSGFVAPLSALIARNLAVHRSEAMRKENERRKILGDPR